MKRLFFLVLLCSIFQVIFCQPTGTVVAFAGPKEKIPKGWVLCDGKLYDRTKAVYTPLFNAIGVSWGGDGANSFAVPDLRGQFLRGAADGSNTDPDVSSRINARADLPSPGNSGDNVGSKEACEIQSHNHDAIATVNRNSIDGSNNSHDVSGGGDKYNADPTIGNLTVSVVIAARGGKETRPTNVYVFYIIKL